MLSDEEKKAMKYFYNLRATIDKSIMLFDEDIEVKHGKETIKQITIVLNLIEKQSKEIEELKAISEYREKIIKGLGLKTLPKTITGFRELIENNDKKWEDKIKAKIEELEKGNKNTFIRGEKILVLQSLLEKE